jgi:hypothetical protein
MFEERLEGFGTVFGIIDSRASVKERYPDRAFQLFQPFHRRALSEKRTTCEQT